MTYKSLESTIAVPSHESLMEIGPLIKIISKNQVPKGEPNCRYEIQSDVEKRYINPESLDISHLGQYHSSYPEFTVFARVHKIEYKGSEVCSIGLGHMLYSNHKSNFSLGAMYLKRIFKDLAKMPGLEFVWTTATKAFGPELAPYIGLEHIATIDGKEHGTHFIYAGEPVKTMGKDDYLGLFRLSRSIFVKDLSH